MKLSFNSKRLLLVLFVPLLYLFFALNTLSDYGINWDEPFHFNRGQAYLHYFLTHETNYLSLPKYPPLRGSSDFMGRYGEDKLFLDSKTSSKPPDTKFRRSYFQSDVFNYEYIIKNDVGHPPLNGILAAFTNFIFYENLGILGDIESHHLSGILIVALSILAISIFTYYNFGLLNSIICTTAFAFYPLLFAESHFNIKDPPVAAFITLSLIALYFGVLKNNFFLTLISAIFGGFALGTKFNAVFLPIIFLPWLVMFLLNKTQLKISKLVKYKKIFLGLILYPLVMFLIIYLFWPYLWQEPIENFMKVITFYKEIGSTPTGEMNSFIFGGFNFFPLYWITITTPLPILLLSLLGLIVSFKKLIFLKQPLYLLIITWFLLPVLRVSLPQAAIFGGVRQVMEFIPAMAILTGIGGQAVYQMAKTKFTGSAVLIVLLITGSLFIWDVARLHPNENVYFNQLIGGLSGAKEKNVPYWGNSYGNAYLQGVEWLNQNAEPNAKLGLAVVNMVNLPRVKLREDIYFSNEYPSGPKMQGEYVMEMSHNWNQRSVFSYAFYDSSLSPVYEVKVDNIPLLKIWKNDPKFLKPGVSVREMEQEILDFRIEQGKVLLIDLPREVFLTKLKIDHATTNCQKQKGGYIKLSVNGKDWTQESETIDYPQIPVKWLGSNDETFVFLFNRKKARFILLDTQLDRSCILEKPEIQIFYSN